MYFSFEVLSYFMWMYIFNKFMSVVFCFHSGQGGLSSVFRVYFQTAVYGRNVLLIIFRGHRQGQD